MRLLHYVRNQTVSQLKFGSQSGGKRAKKDKLSGSSPCLAPVLDPRWRELFQKIAKSQLWHSLNDRGEAWFAMRTSPPHPPLSPMGRGMDNEIASRFRPSQWQAKVIGVVTNWSQMGKLRKWPNKACPETIYSKGIAGAPGGTLLELFSRKI